MCPKDLFSSFLAPWTLWFGSLGRMAPTGHIAVWTILSCQLVQTEISPLNVASHQKLCQASGSSLARDCLSRSIFIIQCQVNVRFILRINLQRLFQDHLPSPLKAGFGSTSFFFFFKQRILFIFPQRYGPFEVDHDRVRDSV